MFSTSCNAKYSTQVKIQMLPKSVWSSFTSTLCFSPLIFRIVGRRKSLVNVVGLASTELITQVCNVVVEQMRRSSFPVIVFLSLVSCWLLYLCQHNSVGALSWCLRGVAEETGGVRPGTHGVGEV